MSAHSVFVLAVDVKPLTPTTPCRARKLLQAGVAKKAWSKFGTFGIQMLVDTRRETPETVLGNDPGTKFEGYSVVVGYENTLNVKLDLPSKRKIVVKMEQRRNLRHRRRSRNCRRRPHKMNRKRKSFLAPSQKVVVDSRLKIARELCRIYPVVVAAVEDSRFNHRRDRNGSNFSAMEYGKGVFYSFFEGLSVEVRKYLGKDTSRLRKSFGYEKAHKKSADIFESHCCDSLTLACHAGIGLPLEPGPFLVVDDRYRPIRRQLHRQQFATGGKRAKRTSTDPIGLRKGLMVGARYFRGQYCGGSYGVRCFYDQNGVRRKTKLPFLWVSSSFLVREVKVG